MSKSIILFLENQELLFEASIPKDPVVSEIISSSDNVKRLIGLSKKNFTPAGLNKNELKEAQELFKDPKVERILTAAQKVGERNGWISGSVMGSVAGGIAGGIASVGTVVPFFALMLLGAVIGGVGIGFLSSKIAGILTRWKAEENISLGGGVRVHT